MTLCRPFGKLFFPDTWRRRVATKIASSAEAGATPTGRRGQKDNVMRIQIHPDNAKWIEAGIDPTRDVIDVDLGDLSEGQRKVLARSLTEDLRNPGVFSLKRRVYPANNTIEAVIDSLLAHEEEEAVGKREEEERIRRNTIEVLDGRITKKRYVHISQDTPDSPPAVGGDTNGVTVDYTQLEPDWPYLRDPDVVNGDAAREWLAEIEAENERRRAEAEAKLPAAWEAKAAIEAEHQSQLSALRDWAVDHGSRRAKLLVEEDHTGWVKVAIRDWIVAHTPEGFTDGAMFGNADERERTVPTVRDIDSLRAARKLCEEDKWLSDPALVFLVWYRSATDDDYDDPDVRVDSDGEVRLSGPAVRLTVKTPMEDESVDIYQVITSTEG